MSQTAGGTHASFNPARPCILGLELLEGFTYDDPWPDPAQLIELSYHDPERANLERVFPRPRT